MVEKKSENVKNLRILSFDTKPKIFKLLHSRFCLAILTGKFSKNDLALTKTRKQNLTLPEPRNFFFCNQSNISTSNIAR